MIVANSNEERVSKAKHSILMIFIGLAIIALADIVVDQVFVLSGGTFIGDQGIKEGATRFNEQVGILTTFMRYIVQGVAFFFIIRSGLALIVGGQEGEVLDKQKKVFMWGIVALVVIMASEAVIKNVLFPVEVGKADIQIGETQIEAGTSLIAQIINV